MSSPPFLRMKGLKGKAIIATAAKHNHREILAELQGQQNGIDPNRTMQNRILRGAPTAAGVANEAELLMTEAGITKLRKDALRGIEIVFSLPPEAAVVQEAFFNDALQWAEGWFAVPVLSAIVHNDEAAPHCHVILLPLVEGRMRGSELMGNRSRIVAMQSDFQTKVGQRHGLVRQTQSPRLSPDARRQVIETAAAKLHAISKLDSELVRVLVEKHFDAPEALMQALDITAPNSAPKAKRTDTFVAIMTRPCKPERKPIGVVAPTGRDTFSTSESRQLLSCVGLADLAPSDVLDAAATAIAIHQTDIKPDKSHNVTPAAFVTGGVATRIASQSQTSCIRSTVHSEPGTAPKNGARYRPVRLVATQGSRDALEATSIIRMVAVGRASSFCSRDGLGVAPHHPDIMTIGRWDAGKPATTCNHQKDSAASVKNISATVPTETGFPINNIPTLIRAVEKACQALTAALSLGVERHNVTTKVPSATVAPVQQTRHRVKCPKHDDLRQHCPCHDCSTNRPLLFPAQTFASADVLVPRIEQMGRKPCPIRAGQSRKSFGRPRIFLHIRARNRLN